jgi:ElaB/YqjD/DUF883 family membrane-anchored ribosome-binding protein
MAKPCKVTIKTSKSAAPKEMTFEEYMEMLYNGALENFIADGTLNANALKGEIAEVKQAEEEKPKTRRKALFGRAVKGLDVEAAKKAIEKYGLTYDVENRTDARVAAQKFIDDVGFDAALQSVRINLMDDGAGAYVFAELIDQLETDMEFAETDQEMADLVELQQQLFNEFDRKARSAGRFISSLDDIYRNSKFGYSAEKKIQEYKDKNSGFIPEDVEKKFRSLDEKIKELNKKIKEAEARAKKAEEDGIIAEIVTSVKQKQTAKTTYTKKAKAIADDFRNKLKTKPIQFKDANGNVIEVKTQGISWNDLVEVGAKAIEASGKIADGIAAMMNAVEQEDWYKNLNSADKDAVRAQVEGVFSEETPGEIQIPSGTIRSLVESGIDNMDDLVAAVKALISDKYPNATDREIRDAITGYGKEVTKTSDDIQAEINGLKRIGKLTSKIEDLQAGIIAETDPKKKAKKTQEEKDLIKQVENLLESSGIKNAKRLDQAKQRAAKRIEELQERLNTGNFSKKKPTPLVEDEELAKLRVQKQNLQDEFDTEMYKMELENRTKFEKFRDALLEIWNIPRALMATGEISFLLIQGGIQTLSHPINAARAFYKAMQHYWSEKKSKEWGDFIKTQPYYEVMKKSKLSLSEFDARLNAQEEQFLGGWVNFMWDYAGWPIQLMGGKAYERWKQLNLFKKLERATVGYMNTIRILRFIDGMKKLEKEKKNFNDNTEEYKNVADVINTLTGRASLGPLEGKASKVLSTVFFSPRNWASVLKTMTPFAFYHFGKMGQKGTYKPSVAQKMAMADFMTYMAITGAMVALMAAKFNDDDDEETEVSLDPYSSDFMKIRLGNTRIDPWAGKQQMIVFQARMIMNAITKGGETKKLGQGMFTPTRSELAAQLVQNKLAPTAALAVKWAQQKVDKEGKASLYGEEFLLSEELAGSLYPMYIGTVNELWEDQPETVSAFLTAYAFLGGGVSTYKTKEQKEKEKKAKEQESK